MKKKKVSCSSRVKILVVTRPFPPIGSSERMESVLFRNAAEGGIVADEVNSAASGCPRAEHYVI